MSSYSVSVVHVLPPEEAASSMKPADVLEQPTPGGVEEAEEEREEGEELEGQQDGKVPDSKGLHICERCNKSFARGDYLRRHVKKHDASPITCKDCGKAFTLESGLRIHSRIHSGEKPYECEECGKRFNQKGNLKIHMRKHTGEKPYRCEYCERDFSQLANLQAHVRIHTGETPYSCDGCGASFTQLSSLWSHQKTHDQPKKPPKPCPTRERGQKIIIRIMKPLEKTETEQIRFMCRLCKKKFRTRFALNRHSCDSRPRSTEESAETM